MTLSVGALCTIWGTCGVFFGAAALALWDYIERRMTAWTLTCDRCKQRLVLEGRDRTAVTLDRALGFAAIHTNCVGRRGAAAPAMLAEGE